MKTFRKTFIETEQAYLILSLISCDNFLKKKKLGLDPVYQFGFLLSRIHIVVYYIYCIFTILSGSTSLYIILYIYILFTEWLTWWNAHFQLHLNVDRKSRSSCISNQIFAQISLRIYVGRKQAYFHGGYYHITDSE